LATSSFPAIALTSARRRLEPEGATVVRRAASLMPPASAADRFTPIPGGSERPARAGWSELEIESPLVEVRRVELGPEVSKQAEHVAFEDMRHDADVHVVPKRDVDVLTGHQVHRYR